MSVQLPSLCSLPVAFTPVRQEANRTGFLRKLEISRHRSKLAIQPPHRAARLEELEVGDSEDDEWEWSDSFTVPTPRLSPQEAVEALFASTHPAAAMHYHAFFSSELGGIVTEPALMVVALDDHLVHRGHAVFDTTEVIFGYAYQTG
eukprot:jgi/Botrbrau1/1035/Bobra.0076s0007.1